MTGKYISCERSANERNARDLAKIYKIKALVDELLVAIASIEPLEHPDSRWHPDDLRAALLCTVADIAAEEARVREPILTPGYAA